MFFLHCCCCLVFCSTKYVLFLLRLKNWIFLHGSSLRSLKYDLIGQDHWSHSLSGPECLNSSLSVFGINKSHIKFYNRCLMSDFGIGTQQSSSFEPTTFHRDWNQDNPLIHVTDSAELKPGIEYVFSRGCFPYFCGTGNANDSLLVYWDLQLFNSHLNKL